MSSGDPSVPIQAAPSAPPPSGAPAYSPLHELTFDSAWSLGWRVLKRNYFPTVVVALIAMFIPTVINQVASYLLRPIDVLYPYAWGFVFGIFVTGPLAAGATLACGRAARGRRLPIGDLFRPYLRFGTILVWALVTLAGSAVALAPAVALFFALNGAIAQGWMILLILTLILLYAPLFLFAWARLKFVVPLLVDPDLPRRDLVQAIQESWACTADAWLTLITISLVGGIFAFATLLLLGVGIVFLGFPLWVALLGSTYAMVTGSQARWESGGKCRYCGEELADVTQCPRCGAPVGGVAM